jgi:hypothetical protein
MVLEIDIKRFHIPQEEGNKFIAIAPIWSGYAEHFKQKPINQIIFEGIYVRWIDLDRHTRQNWHPDNPFSNEKWIEVHLYSCVWKLNEEREYVLTSRTRMGWYGTQGTSCLYFVPAVELRKLYQSAPDGGLVYKSSDRAGVEGRKCVQFWAEAHSNAIANSYY